MSETPTDLIPVEKPTTTALARTGAILTATGAALWAATQATARLTWRALVLVARFTWQLSKFLGRVVLWVCAWPLGLWRSIAHGRNKRTKKQYAVDERRHQEQLEAIRAAQTTEHPRS